VKPDVKQWARVALDRMLESRDQGNKGPREQESKERGTAGM
jgi:hypothetical protein